MTVLRFEIFYPLLAVSASVVMLTNGSVCAALHRVIILMSWNQLLTFL